MTTIWQLPLRYDDLHMMMSDIGYRTKVYSDIRYNVGLCALQSDIGRSDIRLSPISLITDIGLSAHLWDWRMLFGLTRWRGFDWWADTLMGD
jgi:hypothetical protein